MATCFGDTIDAFDALDVPLEETDARHIHMASYFFQPRVRARLPILYKRAKTMGMTTSLDAGWDEQGRWEEGLVEALSVTDFFFPNESEACAIAGTDNVQRAARHIAALGTNAVVKCGEKGTLLCTREGEVLEAPPIEPLWWRPPGRRTASMRVSCTPTCGGCPWTSVCGLAMQRALCR